MKDRPDTIKIWMLRIAIWAVAFALWRFDRVNYQAHLPYAEAAWQEHAGWNGALNREQWRAVCKKKGLTRWTEWRFWRVKEKERRKREQRVGDRIEQMMSDPKWEPQVIKRR